MTTWIQVVFLALISMASQSFAAGYVDELEEKLCDANTYESASGAVLEIGNFFNPDLEKNKMNPFPFCDEGFRLVSGLLDIFDEKRIAIGKPSSINEKMMVQIYFENTVFAIGNIAKFLTMHCDGIKDEVKNKKFTAVFDKIKVEQRPVGGSKLSLGLDSLFAALQETSP